MVHEPHPNRDAPAGLHDTREFSRRFSAYLVRVHRLRLSPTDDKVVDAVLGVGRGVGRTVQFFKIRFVFAKQNLVRVIEVIVELAVLTVVDLDDAVAHAVHHRFVVEIRVAPRPGVAEGNGRQNRNRRVFRPPIMHRHAHHEVFLIGLGVFDVDVEVLVVVEDSCVGNLVFQFGFATPGVFLPDFLVREQILRVLVQHLHVRVRGRAVEVVVQILDIFAVVGLGIGQAKHSLFE